MRNPPRLSPFGEYCSRQITRFGARFNDRGLHAKFVPYYNSGERIRVRIGSTVLTGTVAATAGWAPEFMLMRTTRSRGSSWLLSGGDEVLAVKRGGKYVPA